MKKIVLLLIFSFIAAFSYAAHIKGGFFTYKYLGPGSDATKARYKVTLTVYMECNPPPSTGQLNQNIPFTIFDGLTGAYIRDEGVFITDQYVLSKGEDEECITGDQRVCYYTIVVYSKEIELNVTANGYTISYQRCCRINNINNIFNAGSVGNTWSIKIPGFTGGIADGNSSAEFQINDTVVVCGNSFFQYSFSATDPDNNTLTYEFCDAWEGGSTQNPIPSTATAPPYQSVNYSGGYSGFQPLGPGVTIDYNTGLISGIAPDIPGEYVVTVCVNEYKSGVLIATTRKELHVKVGDCTPIDAALDPVYPTCDGFTRTFQNNSPANPSIKTYFWDFGDGNTSDQQIPTHTYADTGTYSLKLVVNRGEQCSDSTTALVKVYPGFFPDFDFSGICINKPTQFDDRTTAVYGVVDKWSWNFGSGNNISTQQNPSHTYNATGNYNVRFIVGSSKGCIDTVFKTISIIDKPPIQLATKDTLICNGDAVQLQATGNGIFSWTPTTNITNANTATPTVNPSVTTMYYVQLDDNGCINRDSVRVRVVNFVTLNAMPDTTICEGDTLQLRAVSDGLRFQWTSSPSAFISNSQIINPLASNTAVTTYAITARIGSCSATDNVVVNTAPYPIANAGPNDTICYGTSSQLNASITGTSFIWTPTKGLNNPAILSPIASPVGTQSYILTVRDSLSGCPKPKRDTVTVFVLPKINAYAGNDTAVVVGQPLQLQATGGVKYLWNPGTSLSAINIPNPVGLYDGAIESITYKVNVYDEGDCVDSAFVTVRVFKTDPSIFIPTAFTPNGDGNNDVFRPIAVGISKIEYFRVYNRWGQLVFSTTINGQGWDGKIGGKEQGSNVFVWLVRGVDFTGKTVTAKGTVTLIR